MTHVSSPKTSENTQESQKSSAVLWRLCTWKSRKHLIIWILQPCNAVGVVPVSRWTSLSPWIFSPRNAVGVMLVFQWIRLSQWIRSPRNAVGVILMFQWMYLPLWILSLRNSVRVVLLIARGWRGTSLPRVSVRKEIQRCKCWAFSIKACLWWNLLWRITLRKRNTYGVE